MPTAQQDTPIPFEIVNMDDGSRVASNGHRRVMLLEPADKGRMFRRRGVKGLSSRNPAETVLPKLNQFAGELLQNPGMSAEEIQCSLMALVGIVQPPPVQRMEWCVVELDGVRVYVAGNDVIVTKKDLSP